MLKKRQHYVWRKYLSAWVKNGSTIWCNRKGKIFNAGLMNVGQQKFFYKIKRLSNKDIIFLKRFIEHISSGGLKNLNQSWLDIFTYIHKIKDASKELEIDDDELNKKINQAIHNLEEDIHTKIEANSGKYLNSLLEKDKSFYANDTDRANFLFFLMTQYTRTKNMQKSVLGNTESVSFINVENCLGVLRHILSSTIAGRLYVRENYDLILLENDTKLKFITSDQPVINTYAKDLPSLQAPDKLQLYYPISPDLAILISKDKDSGFKNISKSKANQYNLNIASQAYEQIYASSEKLVDNYNPF